MSQRAGLAALSGKEPSQRVACNVPARLPTCALPTQPHPHAEERCTCRVACSLLMYEYARGGLVSVRRVDVVGSRARARFVKSIYLQLYGIWFTDKVRRELSARCASSIFLFCSGVLMPSR